MTREPSQTTPAPLARSMLQGIHRAQAVHVVARLGVADLLVPGPMQIDVLAAAAGARASELNRVMRLLVGEGLFTLDPDGHYGLNDAAAMLRSDVPGTIRPMAIYLGAPHILSAWSRLYESVTEGTVAFEVAHGVQRWDYEAAHPDDYALFQAYQSAQAGRRSPAAYDFDGITTAVDVGGGNGTMLIDVLIANPHLHGVLFDVPEVIRSARDVVASAGMTDRIQLIEGSFLESVPPGGDAYILSNILHDWPDADCLRILTTCRTAMQPGAKLIVVEGVVPSDAATPSDVRYGDLQMMALTGGLQRTLEEFEALFTPTGFGNARVLDLNGNTIVEAVAV